MKTLLTTCCLLISFSAFSADNFVAPSQLTPDQAKQAETSLINNKILLFNHWKERLERANLNNAKLTKSGIPLQKPYYGDSGLNH